MLYFSTLSGRRSGKATISLCCFHHRQQHRIGERAFEKRYSIDLRSLAKEFARRLPQWLKLARTTMPRDPDTIWCIEDAADVVGFGKKAYLKRNTARVLLETWVIREALERLGGRTPDAETFDGKSEAEGLIEGG